MSNIAKVFQDSKSRCEGVLIGYMMAGDPNPQTTTRIAEALIKGGIDILEVGLPFSDPIADGPTIQASSVRALAAGTSPIKVLEIVKQVKLKLDVPIIIMTYYNPVFRIGVERFCRLARDCMVDGLIIPDLPVEEAADYRKAAAAQGLDTIFLAAPSTTNERLAKIIDVSSGFLYLISQYGVTGAKTTVEDSTLRLIKCVKQYTENKIPLAVGFGISKPEHVKKIIQAGAEGAIVGSAFINIVQKNHKDMLQQLKATAAELKAATRTC